MNPLISIIIPTYNRAHLIGETLGSIIAQTYKNWECIVVDDGSTDFTQELMEFYLEKDSRFSYCKRPISHPKGANSCRNFGFELSKGEYINWFDSDDIMHSQKLEIQIAELQKSPKPFCVCQTLVFENTIKNIRGLRYEKIISGNSFYDYLIMKVGFMTPSALWKKIFLQQYDYLFDEELQAAQEWEFHLRILNKVDTYIITEKPLVFIRKHQDGITHNNSKASRLYNYFLARLKIYRNKGLKMDNKGEKFLSEYLLKAFKKMVVGKNDYVYEAYKKFVLREKRFSITAKSNALIAMYSFRFFNRGHIFLHKIKYIK